MIHKFYFTITLLFLLTCSIRVNAASADTVQVTTCQELKTAMRSHKYIQLRADINMKDYGDPVGTFEGTIDGVEETDDGFVYHTLSNMKERLADRLVGASIVGVNFKDCQPCWHFFDGDGMGLLSKYSKSCRFVALSFENVNMYFASSVDDVNFLQSHNNGGLLVGTDEGSTFSGISTSNSYVLVQNVGAGGIAGTATGSTFSDVWVRNTCGTHARGKMEFLSTNVGGIVGIARKCTFRNCQNDGNVSTPLDDVGGIVGLAQDGCTFERCSNYGSVAHYEISSFEGLKTYTAQQAAIANTVHNLFIAERNQFAINSNNYWRQIWDRQLADYNAKLTLYNDYLYQVQFLNGEIDYLDWRIEGLERSESASYKAAAQELRVQKAVYERDLQNLPRQYNPAAENPGELQEMKLESGTNLLTWALMAIQVAQIIYDAQDNDDVGGIVGLMEDGGSLKGCANYGLIFCSDAYAGGIAGEAKGKSLLIDCCYNGGTVSGGEQVGGIVGSMDGGTIRACLNTGNVAQYNGDGVDLGQIYGEKDGITSYGNCISGNKIESESKDVRMVSQQMLASGEAAQYLNKQSGTTYWRQSVGTDMYPSLLALSDSLTEASIKTTIDTTYYVSNALDLIKAGANQYAHIVLTSDIEVGGVFNLSSKFMPFHGTVDGQGHTLRNAIYTTKSRQQVAWSGSRSDDDNALFSYATNATFKNLTLENFNIIFQSGTMGTTEMNALLVARSANCHYENIHITGQSGVTGYGDFWTIGGNVRGHKSAGLVARSQGDTFIDCSVGPSTLVTAATSMVDFNSEAGGLTCLSYGCNFTRCYNAGTVKGDTGDYVGGLSCKDEGSTFNSCLNMGYIQGDTYIGGLVGKAIGSEFFNCVNTGTVEGGGDNIYSAGLAGLFDFRGKTCDDLIHNCFNFGSITKSTSVYGEDGCFYRVDAGGDGNSADKNKFYMTLNGQLFTNLTDQQLDDMKSGTYAFELNKDSVLWYQSLDNHKKFGSWPVPITEAGSVQKNYLCDDTHTLKYSNKYDATEGHSQVLSNLGICNDCGYMAEAPDPDAIVEIYDGQDMADFSTIVSSSATYSSLSARLMNDIDLTGYNYESIGTSEVPYCGTFNGCGHRIMNMNISGDESSPCAFFNYLGNKAEIDSLIIDASCTIKGLGSGVAGIAGCVVSTSGTECNVTINGCANEATITGYQNAAGILGGVYNNDNTNITISGCYNVGAINGTKESATICGYARKNFTITNSYNIGSLTGGSGNAFFRCTDGTHNVTNCFDINGAQDNGVTALAAEQVLSGELCFKLNGSSNDTPVGNGFYQNLDSIGTYPQFAVDKKNIVETFDKTYCNGTTTAGYYNPNRNHDNTQIFHNFDEEGFCTSVSGETHYEEPDTVHHGNTIVYQLKTPGNLYWVAQQVNTGMDYPNCELVNDIVVNKDVASSIAHGGSSNLRKWTPIGTEGHPYQSAYFDGKGHVISGLYLAGEDNAVGLFGLAYNGAVIRNLGVTDCYFWCGTGVGAIVGWGAQSYNDKTTWTDGNGPSLFNCYSTGTVRGEDYLGGLAGFINDGTESKDKLSYLYSLATVYYGDHDGQLFGYMGTRQADVAYADTLYHCYHKTSDDSRDCIVGTAVDEADFYYGKVCQLLNDEQPYDSIVWTQDLATQTAPVFGSDGVKLTRDVSQKWGTAVLNYTLYSDSTVTYYVIDTISRPASSDIATIKLKQVSQVPAFTPCFFYNNSDTTLVVFRSDNREVTVPTTASVDSVETFSNGERITFTGTWSSQELNANQFVLTCDSAMWNKSQITATNVIVEPYHAYFSLLDGTNLSGVKQINILAKGSDFDFNDDGTFDEKDIIFVNSLISGTETSEYSFDANRDGKCTMSDVTTMTERLNHPDTTVLTPPSSTGIISGK